MLSFEEFYVKEGKSRGKNAELKLIGGIWSRSINISSSNTCSFHTKLVTTNAHPHCPNGHQSIARTAVCKQVASDQTPNGQLPEIKVKYWWRTKKLQFIFMLQLNGQTQSRQLAMWQTIWSALNCSPNSQYVSTKILSRNGRTTFSPEWIKARKKRISK